MYITASSSIDAELYSSAGLMFPPSFQSLKNWAGLSHIDSYCSPTMFRRCIDVLDLHLLHAKLICGGRWPDCITRLSQHLEICMRTPTCTPIESKWNQKTGSFWTKQDQCISMKQKHDQLTAWEHNSALTVGLCRRFQAFKWLFQNEEWN